MTIWYDDLNINSNNYLTINNLKKVKLKVRFNMFSWIKSFSFKVIWSFIKVPFFNFLSGLINSELQKYFTTHSQLKPETEAEIEKAIQSILDSIKQNEL